MLEILNETAEEAEKSLQKLFSQILNDPQTGHFYDWKRSYSGNRQKRDNALKHIFLDPFVIFKLAYD